MNAGSLGMAEIGALLGDPARANILVALIDGRALTAKELASAAGVTPQTTSGHLAKLAAANLIALEKQGRHRYYRLAAPLVGSMLEGVMTVASVQLPARHGAPWRLDEAMRNARTCYDHIAGRLGVGLAAALVARGHVVLGAEGGAVTAEGTAFFASLGIALARPADVHRIFCRPCLDWSERRWHIAGAVGAALCTRFLDLRWIERQPHTRALAITADGTRRFAHEFGVAL
jgi:DNA-binding transcriptional ArsR family regulator